MKNRPLKKLENSKITKKVEFEKYGYYLSLSSDEREKIFGFHTDGGFAKKFKVSQETLVTWKDSDNLWEIRDRHLRHFKQYTANIYRALYGGAMERKSAAEIKLWLQAVEGWKESVKTEGGVKVGFEEEFEEQIEAIIQLLDTAGERASQNPVNSNRKAKTG